MTDDSNEKTTLERVEAALEQAKAAAAEIPTPKPDGRARDEQRYFDHQESMQKVQLGILGKLWGAKHEKLGNFSGAILVILTLYLGAILIVTIVQENNENFLHIFSGITSIITLILGYLFGSSGQK